MRPRRARLGYLTNDEIIVRAANRFNEAEARAPRILPAYKPLRIKAISARFRAMSHSVRQKTGSASGKILTMSKSDTQYNRLHRFERRQSFR